MAEFNGIPDYQNPDLFNSSKQLDAGFSMQTDPNSLLYSPQPQLFQGIGDIGGGGNDKTGVNIWGQGGKTLAAGIQGIGSLGSAFAAYKQYKLGKQTLDQNKQAFNLNSANQAKITNAQIQDRARYNAANRDRSLTGDFAAIDAASQKEYNERKVSGQGIG